MAKTLKMKQDKDGNYLIKNDQDAKHLLEHMAKKKGEIEHLRKVHGLDALDEDRKKASKAIAEYLAAKNRKAIRTPEIVGEVVERTKSFWIWSEDDIPEGLEARSLRRILRLKFRNKEKYNSIVNHITRRVIIPEGIQELVNEGVLKKKDIEDAFVTVVETRYMNLKPNLTHKKSKVLDDDDN